MTLTTENLKFDSHLLQKYNQPLPRYTSYPPATELKSDFQVVDFEKAIAVGNQKKLPLSLYCHIPFCDSACYFCGCNTIITQKKELAQPYLNYLMRNISQIADYLDKDRLVNQMHWGGGTPNYLNLTQIESLWNAITSHFTFESKAEISLEVNPRSLDKNYIFFLRDLGFNRISFGIQDFNFQVQQAINRIQPETMLFNVMDWMREANFESVNVDLIYGLPEQTLDSFRETIRKTITLNPDRIAVFNFAYVPWLKPVQKKISQDKLPQGLEKLAMLQMTIEELTQNGYVYIGMDHFAKPDDELAIAQREGKLHRNFQGYTTKPESELFGFGITSISMLHDVYVQNHKKLKDYYQAIEERKIPLDKGVKLNKDDVIRRASIMELMCQFSLGKNALEEKYNLGLARDFDDYFAEEIPDLEILEEDGLLRHLTEGIEVTPKGRLLIRNVASIFDSYLRKHKKDIFSKSI